MAPRHVQYLAMSRRFRIGDKVKVVGMSPVKVVGMSPVKFAPGIKDELGIEKLNAVIGKVVSLSGNE